MAIATAKQLMAKAQTRRYAARKGSSFAYFQVQTAEQAPFVTVRGLLKASNSWLEAETNEAGLQAFLSTEIQLRGKTLAELIDAGTSYTAV